ncbi:MAG: hypothetical protein AB7N76_18990 [Planctomycetota bacterium]
MSYLDKLPQELRDCASSEDDARRYLERLERMRQDAAAFDRVDWKQLRTAEELLRVVEAVNQGASQGRVARALAPLAANEAAATHCEASEELAAVSACAGSRAKPEDLQDLLVGLSEPTSPGLLLTREDLAHALGVTPQAVSHRKKSGLLPPPADKRGGRLWWSLAAVAPHLSTPEQRQRLWERLASREDVREALEHLTAKADAQATKDTQAAQATQARRRKT